MMRINRIGNKLGALGGFCILLSAGMLVNQLVTEVGIRTANDSAERQQRISTAALEANIGLRRMQLSARDVLLARDAATA